MDTLIKQSQLAMASVMSVLSHSGVDFSEMDEREMIGKARSISALCAHEYDRKYRGKGTRVCKKCGGLQSN